MKVEWKHCLRIGVSIFALYLCIYYWPAAVKLVSLLVGASSPLFLGGALAYVLNILMRFYEQHYFRTKSYKRIVAATRRPICLVGAVLTLIAIIFFTFYLVVPKFVECIVVLFSEIPAWIETQIRSAEFKKWIPEEILKAIPDIDWQSRLSQVAQVLLSGASNIVDAVTSVFNTTVTIFLGIIFAVYLLVAKDRLRMQCGRVLRAYLRPSWCEKLLHVIGVADDCFHSYIVGQCMEAAILGVLCAVGMSVLQFPYAWMIGALVAVTALIPVAGAYIGAGIGAIIILTVSPLKALFFLLFIVILQQLEGNLIYPKVVGESIGLPGIWVLAAVTVGGSLCGILGMLIGVPLTAVLYRLVREDVRERERA